MFYYRIFPFLFLAFLLPGGGHAVFAQEIHLESSCQAPKVALLSWTAPDTCTPPFSLFRKLPGESWQERSDQAITPLYDTLPSMLCGDTVRYKILCSNGASNISATAMEDVTPTSECSICVASVEDSSQNIILTWLPNPDPDILGYYLCSGFPCTDYDTVWGPSSHSYSCSDLSSRIPHTFRLLAFDSCMQAGPLSPSFGNMVISLSSDTSTRSISLTWNPYLNMPRQLAGYAIFIRYGKSSSWHILDTLPADRTDFQITLPGTDSVTLFSKILAFNADHSLEAFSNIDSCTLPALPHDPGGDDTSETSNPLVYIPNCFTPSLDINNTFCPVIQELDPANYSFYIYNRHGGRVFFTRDPSQSWDGTYHGTLCPQGSYVYHIQARHYTGGVQNYTGTVLLLR